MDKTKMVCLLPMDVQKRVYDELVKAVGKVHAKYGMYSRLCDLEDTIDVQKIVKEVMTKRNDN